MLSTDVEIKQKLPSINFWGNVKFLFETGQLSCVRKEINIEKFSHLLENNSKKERTSKRKG